MVDYNQSLTPTEAVERLRDSTMKASRGSKNQRSPMTTPVMR